jgi:metallo-beta-lactamase class B
MNQPLRIWQDIYVVGSAEISHPYDCCVYLVDAGELILIDAGAGQSFSRLIDNIHAFGLAPERLNSILVTHCHIDHIGALARFKQEYNVKVIAHELDAQAIESGKGVGAEVYGVEYQPCLVDIKIEESEHNLHFSRHDLKAIHIPGHTPGSLAIYTEIAGRRVLFGQDIHGPYEIAWGGNLNKAINSLQKLVGLKADMLCEGHFGVYQPGDRVKRYIESYIYQLEQRADRNC